MLNLPIYRSLLLVSLWALTQVPCTGQELRTNAAGEKIIVYEDGSARYFNDLSPVEGQGDTGEPAYPVLSVNIEPLGEALTPTETDLRRIAERRLDLAREALSLAGTRASAARTTRRQLAQRLNAARSAGDSAGAADLERQLALATSLDEDAATDFQSAETAVADLETTLRTGRYVEAYNAEQRRRRSDLADVNLPRGTDRKLSLLLPKEPAFTGYGPATSRAGIREPLPCATGLVTGVPSNGAEPATPLLPFFSFTDPALRPFLEGREYLNASAYTARGPDGPAYLHLRLNFTQVTARNAYGTLPAGASLSIHFLNGRSITLAGQRESIGIVDHRRQELNYDVDYPLTRAATQALQRNAVDYVRIFWSGGYEEYPVLRVDALRRLVGCL